MASSKTVLIVDDIPYVRKTLKQILSSHGFKVVGEAENGHQAVEMFFETQPDVVTMDLVMPVMNGVDAVRKIVSRQADAKIVVLSAMMQENLVTESILAGAKDYIVKPFQTEDVIRILNKVLEEDEHEASLRNAGGAA